ncbi:MAG: biotin/lipoate A/B protein ligase family protein [Syntrophomonadaceae bacterium]|nr:biotin/lipoate A/B protein ligase family protein [Syntrophomonadaceae bacterium]
MKLYNLGRVSWWESQCYYHALSYLGREGLIICSPTSAYVCLGLHDDLKSEIAVDYCQKKNIPLLRRETGGGVVYLDSNQVFYQMVLRRDNPLLPLQRGRFYPYFLKPAILTYRKLGIPAQLHAPADITVKGRKCSGNAAGDIGESVAYVGNILLDFDYERMSRVLRIPCPEVQPFLNWSMQLYMTTIKDWLDYIPGYQEIAGMLVEGFSQTLGELYPAELDLEVIEVAAKLYTKLTGSKWLSLPGRKQQQRRIKIAEGVYLEEDAQMDERSTFALNDNGEVMATFSFTDKSLYQLQQIMSQP